MFRFLNCTESLHFCSLLNYDSDVVAHNSQIKNLVTNINVDYVNIKGDIGS